MTWSHDRKALVALAVATLGAAADLTAFKLGRYDLGAAALLALPCTALAAGSLVELLCGRSRRMLLWSLGTIAATFAVFSMTYAKRLCTGNHGAIELGPWLGLVVGALIVIAMPLVFPVLAWAAVGIAHLFDRVETARWAVPVAVIALFAFCVVVYPPALICSH
jgi:hypothetical protein